MFDPELDVWYDPRPNAYFPGDPGGGPWDEETQTRWWWAETSDESTGIVWDDIWENFNDLEADFHEIYGVDFGSNILNERDWRWFKTRTEGLLDRDTRIATTLGCNIYIPRTPLL